MALGLLPAVLAMRWPVMGFVALAWNGLALVAVLVDFLLAPRGDALELAREVSPVLSSGVPNPVTLVLASTRPVRGELRDLPAPGVHSEGHRQRFSLARPTFTQRLRYTVTPPTRGRLAFGDVTVRLLGPLGLAARQRTVPLPAEVRVFPDLTALAKDALALATPTSASAGRAVPRREEGREFDSLREYRPGDGPRSVDWKASARRGRLIVRDHRPERNQAVLLLLDCGRHMAGVVQGRRKLDHAVDAALRLAKVCLDAEDAVGVVAFGTRIHAHLPPRKGPEQLRALTHALYEVEAELEESDYGAALDVAFARHHRRTLVVVFTDLQDPHSARALLERTLRLRPRHLPLVASLLDEDVRDAATHPPADALGAYVRPVAARLEDEYRLAVARLVNAGALAVRSPASTFGARTVNAYLRLKARGQL